VFVGKRIRAIHPRLAPIIKEFDRYEEPAGRAAHESDKLHSAPIPVSAASDEVRCGKHRWNVGQTQAKPLRMSPPDVFDALWKRS
jgi:hypothetical protein